MDVAASRKSSARFLGLGYNSQAVSRLARARGILTIMYRTLDCEMRVLCRVCDEEHTHIYSHEMGTDLSPVPLSSLANVQRSWLLCRDWLFIQPRGVVGGSGLFYDLFPASGPPSRKNETPLFGESGGNNFLLLRLSS